MSGGRFLLLALLVAFVAAERESRLIHTPQGDVIGYKSTEGNFFEYYGIPYASTPRKESKFMAPMPGPAWGEPLEAVDKTIYCPQNLNNTLMPTQGEIDLEKECLVVNVFVPDIESKELLPVVVYIHGGAFQIGHGNFLTPKKIVNEGKFIAVTFNYRLGIHGFLCLGTEKAPGNAGLKDQVALLRWVQRNIERFGGNPDDVTITGYSAGAASVEFLMLSELTDGLFVKAVPESGSALSGFATQVDPIENAKEYARTKNFYSDNIAELEKFYLALSYDEIMSADFLNRADGNFLFVPCVEQNVKGAFITESPERIYKSKKYNKVPILISVADSEGALRIDSLKEYSEGMNKKFADYLPANLKFESEEQRDEVAQKIKEFYFGDKLISEDTTDSYIDFFTDTMFLHPAIHSVKLNLEAGNKNVYYYMYTYMDDMLRAMTPHPQVQGAMHCAQTTAVMEFNGVVFDESYLTEGYQKMRKILREIWFNFISTGEPVPEPTEDFPNGWPVPSKDALPAMILNVPPSLEDNFLQERIKLWEDVYSKHYREPVPPQVKKSSAKTEL